MLLGLHVKLKNNYKQIDQVYSYFCLKRSENAVYQPDEKKLKEV